MTRRATVPLPARFGLGPIYVASIDARTITMGVPIIGSDFATDGGCSAGITGPGANTMASVDLTCRAGDKAVINNKMRIEVLGISATHKAVIRIRPAA